MMKLTNYHTHSHYCDGTGQLREYVEYALGKGFACLGFSGHAPFPLENKFAIKDCDYDNYCSEVRSLRDEYAGRIDIRLGLETDYIPHVIDDFEPLSKRGGLDYCIGSVHQVSNRDEDPRNLWFIDGKDRNVYDEGLQRVFGGDIRKGVAAFFRQNIEMLERCRPTVIGHFTKVFMHNAGRFFSESEPWVRALVRDTIDSIAATGTICEINTRGIYRRRYDDYYPSREIIRYMDCMNIPVIVSSDAHKPEETDMFCGAYEFLKEIGYRNILTEI